MLRECLKLFVYFPHSQGSDFFLESGRCVDVIASSIFSDPLPLSTIGVASFVVCQPCWPQTCAITRESELRMQITEEDEKKLLWAVTLGRFNFNLFPWFVNKNKPLTSRSECIVQSKWKRHAINSFASSGLGRPLPRAQKDPMNMRLSLSFRQSTDCLLAWTHASEHSDIQTRVPALMHARSSSQNFLVRKTDLWYWYQMNTHRERNTERQKGREINSEIQKVNNDKYKKAKKKKKSVSEGME